MHIIIPHGKHGGRGRLRAQSGVCEGTSDKTSVVQTVFIQKFVGPDATFANKRSQGSLLWINFFVVKDMKSKNNFFFFGLFQFSTPPVIACQHVEMGKVFFK